MTHKSGFHRAWTWIIWGVVGTCCVGLGAFARPQAQQTRASATASKAPTKAEIEFFESKVRPIFVDNCYRCHSPAQGTPRSGLELDWKGGWEKGGAYGPSIVPGNPDKSLLIKAVTYTDSEIQMPPAAKLSTSQIDDLIAWVRMGAPDPRTTRPSGSVGNIPKYGGSGKEHWSFKPVTKPTPPAVKNPAWAKNEIDRFVLAKLEAAGIAGSAPADKRTLIRRAFYDLIGLPPNSQQVHAFLADNSPNAFEKVVDALLASPHYGERWGRHWLDVARYSDTKGLVNRQRESQIYAYAWTYRDYVIRAFNEDRPYDQFIREQLAADRLNWEKDPSILAALGFLTLGDRFNGNASDIINDRIDVTSKAFLGLTVTCARCHDHKFDPIPTADYYSLYGIFANSAEPTAKPMISPPNQDAYTYYAPRRRDLDERMKTMLAQSTVDVLGDYRRLGAVYLMSTQMTAGAQRDAYLTRNGANPALAQNWLNFTRSGGRQGQAIFGVWRTFAGIQQSTFVEQVARIMESLFQVERAAMINPVVLKAFQGKYPINLTDVAAVYGRLFARTDPEWENAFGVVLNDAVLRMVPARTRNQYFQLRDQGDMLELVDAGAPARAHVLVDVVNPQDTPILVRGQAETPGKTVPRRFLEILSGSNRPRVKSGSGRLELADAIASKTNPLTARVMVNRVWQHHFGDGIVSTPDDLGNQSSPPTHPELLDWLATKFMSDGWSIKKLHKAILLSATWQQSSQNNGQFAEKDPRNQLLWRANIRRLEFEPFRDFILSIGDTLDLTLGGHPIDISEGLRAPGRGANPALSQLSKDRRRSVYAYVDRTDMSEVLNTFDFANPGSPTGRRYETTQPQQALFLMNSPLVVEQVRNVVNRPDFANADSDEERVAYLYELFFQRLPNEAEFRAGKEFVAGFQTANGALAPPAPRGATPPIPGVPAVQARGRGGSIRPPLNGWQEYAHALLLTNEAAFIN